MKMQERKSTVGRNDRKKTLPPRPSGPGISTVRRKKPAGTIATEPSVGLARRVISAEERRRMIAEAAYFKAERRGFEGGRSDLDWLDAEAEIDAMLMRDGVGIDVD